MSTFDISPPLSTCLPHQPRYASPARRALRVRNASRSGVRSGGWVLLSPGDDLLRAADPLALVRFKRRHPEPARVRLHLLAAWRLQRAREGSIAQSVLDVGLVAGL